jgi:hypothetical protein
MFERIGWVNKKRMNSNREELIKMDKEDFRMYHQLQYERISQLEQQRLTMTNFVIGISLLAFTFGFSDFSNLNLVTAIGLPVAIIISNLFAMLYTSRSRKFIKMHQKRAEKARELYSKDLNRIYESVPKVESEHDFFSRARLQIYLHLLLIAIALLPLIIYLLRIF